MNNKTRWGLLMLLIISILALVALLTKLPKQSPLPVITPSIAKSSLSSAKSTQTLSALLITPTTTLTQIPLLTLAPTLTHTPRPPLVPFPEATFESTPDVSRPWPVYTNSKWGFSIEHPRAGITAHETIPLGETLPRFHATFSFVSPDRNFVNVLVEVEDAPPDLSLDQIFEKRFSDLASSDPLPMVLSLSAQSIAKLGAKSVKAYVLVEGSYQILALYNSRLYIISLAQAQGSSQDAQTLFGQMVSTFKFIK